MEEDNTIEFTYKRSPLFRVIKVDGAWGGATPRFDIQMGIYSERVALPDSETFETTSDGLGKRVDFKRQTKGPVREVEAMLSMSLPVARAVAAWITSKADEMERLINDHVTELVTTHDSELTPEEK